MFLRKVKKEKNAAITNIQATTVFRVLAFNTGHPTAGPIRLNDAR
jgi:hypothetical protein